MKYLTLLFFAFCLTGLWWACRNEGAPSQAAAAAIPEPVTPEEVVRRFQSYLDNNQFAEAQALSTPDGQEVLRGMAEVVASEPADSTVFHTEFLSINCQEKVDTAFCRCKLKDEYEAYESDYKLLRINGRWLVDAPEEGSMEGDEDYYEMLDSLIEQ